MARLERKRVDLAMDHALYNQVLDSAAIDGRSVNAQIGWLLEYALIDWRYRYESRYIRTGQGNAQ